MWKVLLPIVTVAFAVTSAGLVGGPSDADISDEGVQNALQFAVVQHNKGTNDAFVTKVSKVIKVQKQVDDSDFSLMSSTVFFVCLFVFCHFEKRATEQPKCVLNGLPATRAFRPS